MDIVEGRAVVSQVQQIDNRATEHETKPPSNVKVGLLFRPHAVRSIAAVSQVKAELTGRLTEFFSPKSNNILLMENASASADPKQQALKRRIEEGYTFYRSFRKARIAAYISPSGPFPKDDAALDKFVTRQEKDILKHPERNPEYAYMWIVEMVLDDLITKGYTITKISEKGIADPVREISSEHRSLREYQEVVRRLAQQWKLRDHQTVEQIGDLVGKAQTQQDNTNIAALFGSNHQLIAAELPENIQGITTTYAAAIDIIPQQRILGLLRQGKNVPEALWLDAYFRKDQRSVKGPQRRFLAKARGSF